MRSYPMIRLIIFDLDGVLVQTEKLKALSYARAILKACPGKVTEENVKQAYHEGLSSMEFCPLTISEYEVIDAYMEMVGHSRQEMAKAIIRRFGLETALRPRMAEYGVAEPWQVLIKVRMPIYESLIADPQILLDSQWPECIALLRSLKQEGYLTALATMSSSRPVQHILEVLGLTGSFDHIATAGDISRGKPDPEIYQLIYRTLNVSPSECLVLEDSPSGIEAGLAAGMRVLAVTTPFTRLAVHAANILESRWIVDEPEKLKEVVRQVLREGEGV